MVSHNTIGLMMDCDTTGVEPDLALVKFKKLVGGGSMQIVNQTVPRALKNLGYQPEQAEAIIEYIAEHGHVVDAPGPAARALRGLRLRHGRARDQPDGPRPDDGRRPARAERRHLQDCEPARERHGRGHRADLLRGLEARPEGAGDLPRQLQGGPAAVGLEEEAGRGGSRRRARAARGPAGPPPAAQAAVGHGDAVLGRGRGRLHDRLQLPGRRRRGGLPQARQAGLHPGRA